jgi:dodecin
MDLQPMQRSCDMAEASVARITEISAKSTQGFEDAIRIGLNRAQKTLRNVTSAWIKEQRVIVDGDRFSYQVNMEVTFVLDE